MERWGNVVVDWSFSWEGVRKCNFRVEFFSVEGWGNVVSDWSLLWEELRTCNFRVEFFLGGVAKSCFRLELSLEGLRKCNLRARMQF